MIHTFLKEQGLGEDWLGIYKNSPTFETFEKRFFTWFSAFRIMKLMHWLRDNDLPNETLVSQVPILLQKMNFKSSNLTTPKEMLLSVREIEKAR